MVSSAIIISVCFEALANAGKYASAKSKAPIKTSTRHLAGSDSPVEEPFEPFPR